MSWLKVQLWKGIRWSWIFMHNLLRNRSIFFMFMSMWCESYYARYMNLLQYSYTVLDPCLRSGNSCCLLSTRPLGMWWPQKALQNSAYGTW
jgi:hypothetical protein